MAREISKEMNYLKEKMQSNNVVIGTDSVLKRLRSGKLSKVFLSSNCPEAIRKDVEHYAGILKVPVIKLDQNNEELGIFCKKNFFVSVLGIIGE